MVLPTMQDCSEYTATVIKDQIDNEELGMTYDDFGVACRTTRELLYFTSALIEKGIPFRSKKHPFKGPVMRGLIPLLGIMSPEERTDEEINEAVIQGVKSPDFGLSPYTMRDKLDKLATGMNYYEFFVEKKGYRKVYSGGKWGDRAKAYAKFLESIYGQAEDLGPEGSLEILLNYEGPFGSMVESMIESVKNDPQAIETILDENLDADVASDSIIRDYALQPLDPFRSVLEHFDSVDEAFNYVQTVIKKSEALSKSTNPSDPSYNEPAVSLDTVHGWKGLEAKQVFVPMYESGAGGFPHNRSAQDEDLLASERRLAYVAITRGEDEVTILRPQINPLSEKFPVTRSRFVDEACIPIKGENSKTSSVSKRSKRRIPDDVLEHFINEDYDEFSEELEMLEQEAEGGE